VHSMGVVHRDVKPSNIMMAPAGTVTLVDFGIARMRAEIVTGKKPFDQGSAFSIMSAHMQQNPVPPREVEPTLSESILQAIAKNPSSRFQALEEFMLAPALASALASSRTVLPAAPARGFRPYYCGPQRIRRSSPSEIVGLRRGPSRGPGKWHSPRTTTVLLRAFDSDRSGPSGTSILKTSLKMSRGVAFAWAGRHRRKRSSSLQADPGWILQLGSSRRNAFSLPP
jgi:serine/threonine protein kinase